MVNIGAISKISHPETENRHSAVKKRNGENLYSVDAEKLVIQEMNRKPGNAVHAARPGKGISKYPPDVVHGFFRSVQGNAPFVQDIKTAQVIQSQDVIHMMVGKNDRIQAGDPGTQHLLPVIHGGVDQDIHFPGADKRGGSQPVIAGIRRKAHPAVTSYHRNPHGGSAAQNFHF